MTYEEFAPKRGSHQDEMFRVFVKEGVSPAEDAKSQCRSALEELMRVIEGTPSTRRDVHVPRRKEALGKALVNLAGAIGWQAREDRERRDAGTSE